MKANDLIMRLATNTAAEAYFVARQLRRHKNPMQDGYLRGWDHACICTGRHTFREIRLAVSPRRWREILAECRRTTAHWREQFAKVQAQRRAA